MKKNHLILGIVFFLFIFISTVSAASLKDNIVRCSHTAYNTSALQPAFLSFCTSAYDGLLNDSSIFNDFNSYNWTYDADDPNEASFYFDETYIITTDTFTISSSPDDAVGRPDIIDIYACINDTCTLAGQRTNITTGCGGASVPHTNYTVNITSGSMTLNKLKILMNTQNCGFFNSHIAIQEFYFDSDLFRPDNNTLPNFNVTFTNNTYCLDSDTGVATVEFNISAYDTDTIYYATTAGYSGGEAYIYDFDNFDYNVSLPLLTDASFFITCVIQTGNINACSVFSRTGILPDLNELQDDTNLQTNCPIAKNTWNATETNKSIVLKYDSTKGYMLNIDSDGCTAGTGDYLVINDKRAEERDFTSYIYIEPEINSSFEFYYTYFIHNPKMDKVNITKDDTNILVYTGSTLILNTTNTSLYLKFDMRIDAALYDIFIYDTDFNSDNLTLLATSGNHSITDSVISFLQIEPYTGTMSIDDILFTDYLDPVTYSTVKPTSETYPYAGTFSITFYVTDSFGLTDYSNFQTFEFSINGFCVDPLDPNKVPTTVKERGTLGGILFILREIYKMSRVFDSFPIIQSVGSIFYILIFLMFLFRSNFDFINSLGKSSMIVFVYSLLGLTYTFVGLTALIMLIIVIVLKVQGSRNES